MRITWGVLGMGLSLCLGGRGVLGGRVSSCLLSYTSILLEYFGPWKDFGGVRGDFMGWKRRKEEVS